jgi:hypothetical protein
LWGERKRNLVEEYPQGGLGLVRGEGEMRGRGEPKVLLKIKALPSTTGHTLGRTTKGKGGGEFMTITKGEETEIQRGRGRLIKVLCR